MSTTPRRGSRSRSFSNTELDRERTTLTRVYGFVISLTALALLALYLFVALAPSVFVQEVFGTDIEGVQRIAGTVPVILVLVIVYVLSSYACIDLMNTPALDDYRLITDKHARSWTDSPGDVPIIADLPKVMWSRDIVAAAKLSRE